ncbi:MAG: hypothetical protein D6693_09600 [Planctomycetota bacterium]|nr:MAG: hypothetical protein D6693_09600 [Planctomycetota bacterium]
MLFSSLIISLVGLGLFLYGKKSGNLKCLGGGIALSVAPYFAPSVAVMWMIAVGVTAGLYGLAKWA